MRLYLHIPFCERKCHYCSFASTAGAERLYRRYCDALNRELRLLPRRRLASLFFGGGTPTSLPVELLVETLDLINHHCGFDDTTEVSIEANPGTVSVESLGRLRAAGVNRLSLGVQSFDDAELRLLGRIHSADDAERAVEMARSAGFANLSLDLISALPGQSVAGWRRSLQRAVALQPQHLSLYQLTPEEGTPLAAALDRGELRLPDEEVVAAIDEVTAAVTAAAGYLRYEISNYARSGFRCRHNIAYWRNEEWYAAGAAAVSYVAGCRSRREESPQHYIDRIMTGGSAVVAAEQLSTAAAFRETVIVGLRMVEGVEYDALIRRFATTPRAYYKEVIQRLIDHGLVEETATHLRLTAKGLRLANPVMAELV